MAKSTCITRRSFAAGMLSCSLALLAGCSESDPAAQDTPATQPDQGPEAVLVLESSDGGQEEDMGAADAQLETCTLSVSGVEFTMILVKAGTFTMGSDNADVQFSESPAHEVTLTRDYLIGETEVTEALWRAVTGYGSDAQDMPKTSITWQAAADFCDELTALAREQGVIGDDIAFRLPTEAQWEFAAKGGNESLGYRFSGSDSIDEVAVTRENSGSDAPGPVRTKAPNELGIYDMSGNAYEWTADLGAAYDGSAQTDPLAEGDGAHVKRGGSNYHWFSSEPYLFTTTGRYFYGSTDWTIGMRLALW